MFHNYCCCCSLKTGCTAIGALEWIYTLYLTCRYNDLSKVHCGRGSKITCSQIYYNIISFIVSAAIVYGTKKNTREFFIPWLIIKIIEYTIFTSIMIYDLQNRFSFNNELIIPLAFVLVTILVLYYSWACVLLLYFKMKPPEEDKLVDQSNDIQEVV